MPRIGHADALLAADQQLLTEMLLQRRQLLAERGLRDMQQVGGAVTLPLSTITMKDLRRLMSIRIFVFLS